MRSGDAARHARILMVASTVFDLLLVLPITDRGPEMRLQGSCLVGFIVVSVCAETSAISMSLITVLAHRRSSLFQLFTGYCQLPSPAAMSAPGAISFLERPPD